MQALAGPLVSMKILYLSISFFVSFYSTIENRQQREFTVNELFKIQII
ncbi:hypothetical protein RV10_GL004209 [Enterococcus pallens]|nr:hypothetical protein RV10_GL004209 [Enterococcus pallens]